MNKAQCKMLCFVFMLAGCTTVNPYIEDKSGQGNGYSHQQMEDGSYLLKFSMTKFGGNPRETAFALWHRRAEELCDSDQYEENIFGVTERLAKYYEDSGTNVRIIEIEGILICSGETDPSERP